MYVYVYLYVCLTLTQTERYTKHKKGTFKDISLI